MGWETVGAQKGGTAVYLWLIHVDVWRRPTRCCKAIILQLKKKKRIFVESHAGPSLWFSFSVLFP